MNVQYWPSLVCPLRRRRDQRGRGRGPDRSSTLANRLDGAWRASDLLLTFEEFPHLLNISGRMFQLVSLGVDVGVRDGDEEDLPPSPPSAKEQELRMQGRFRSDHTQMTGYAL